MTVVARSSCRAPYQEVDPDSVINRRVICAGGGRADACTGDSGGPLMAVRRGGWTLVGVTSYGVGCGNEKFPGVYFSVDKYTRWIYNKIRVNHNPQG